MVDPYIAAQIAARRSPSVAKTKLLNLRSNYPSGYVFAIEGDIDKAVYSHWIARLKPDLAYEFLVLKGKKQVRQLKNALTRDLGGLSADVKFIVDRDFDNMDGFTDGAHVFMLDRYSIENYLADPITFGRILVTAYPCEGYPQLRRQIEGVYAADLNVFLSATANLNCRIYTARRLGIPIDDAMPSSANAYVAIAIGATTPIVVNPAQSLPFQQTISRNVQATLDQEFLQLHPMDRYRGKFLLKFFNSWLEKLGEEFRRGTIGLFGTIGPQTGSIVTSELTVGAMAARSPLPVGFAAFLP